MDVSELDAALAALGWKVSDFCRATGLSPARVAMVGDSLHDLEAGRAAKMHRIAVLTGIATAADLAPHADAVMPDIAGLADWIDALAPV